MVVHAFAPGECTIMVPFSSALERPGGVVSGMTIMGAADVAMWLAIMTHRGTRETRRNPAGRPVTRQMLRA
jgi:acyl-coenzyme A thioesterase PaaI-like protein